MKNRLTLNYDEVAAAVPVNRGALAVTRNTAANEHFEHEHKEHPTLLHWENCPKLIPISEIKHPYGRALAQRICGIHKFGRMTVVGLFAERVELANQQIPAIWVCRCTCGCYEGRRHRAIFNPENKDDMCRNCRHLEHIKRRYKELGSI